MTAQEQYNDAHLEWEEGWDFEYMLKRYGDEYVMENRLDTMEVFSADGYTISEVLNIESPEEAFEIGRKLGGAKYFRFNGYGHIEPVDDKLSYYMDYIDEDEFKEWCIDYGKYDEEPELEDFEDEDDY